MPTVVSNPGLSYAYWHKDKGPLGANCKLLVFQVEAALVILGVWGPAGKEYQYPPLRGYYSQGALP